MQEIRKKDFLKRNWELIDSILSLGVDLFMVNLSVFLSLRLFPMGQEHTETLRIFWLFINIMFILLSMGFGMYRSRFNLSLQNLSFSYLRLVLLLALLTAALLFVLKQLPFPRMYVFSTFLIMLVLFHLTFFLFRMLRIRLVSRHKIGFKAILIGDEALVKTFTAQIKKAFGDFFRIMGFLGDEGNPEKGGCPGRRGKGFLGWTKDLEAIVHQYRPDIVCVLTETVDINDYREIYRVCQRNAIKLKIISPRFNHILHHPKIRDVLGISLVVDSWRIYYWRFNARLKRIMDISLIFPLLLVFLPMGLVLTALVKLTSKGPVFFKQRRVMFKGGRDFFCYKFRSMYVNADEMKNTLRMNNDTNGILFKMKKDPRVTPFGRFIRKLSLDELPQLINVLKGEMTLVGPRPLPVDDVARIPDMSRESHWQSQRGIVKPGLTGLWQILGRSELSFKEMIFLDLYYIEHQSLFFDLEILFSTLPSILFGKGAY